MILLLIFNSFLVSCYCWNKIEITIGPKAPTSVVYRGTLDETQTQIRIRTFYWNPATCNYTTFGNLLNEFTKANQDKTDLHLFKKNEGVPFKTLKIGMVEVHKVGNSKAIIISGVGAMTRNPSREFDGNDVEEGDVPPTISSVHVDKATSITLFSDSESSSVFLNKTEHDYTLFKFSGQEISLIRAIRVDNTDKMKSLANGSFNKAQIKNWNKQEVLGQFLDVRFLELGTEYTEQLPSPFENCDATIVQDITTNIWHAFIVSGVLKQVKVAGWTSEGLDFKEKASFNHKEKGHANLSIVYQVFVLAGAENA